MLLIILKLDIKKHYILLFRLKVENQLDGYKNIIYDYVIESFIFKDGQVLKFAIKDYKSIPFGFYLLVRPKDVILKL